MVDNTVGNTMVDVRRGHVGCVRWMVDTYVGVLKDWFRSEIGFGVGT